jgi:hypothetical protein
MMLKSLAQPKSLAIAIDEIGSYNHRGNEQNLQ